MKLGEFQNKIKLFGFLGLLVLVLGVTVVIGKQASVVFQSRASSCPASAVSSEQVSANSAVVKWSSDADTQGRVEYGTSAVNLAFTAPEGTAGKTHNVPLTLLTPNTVYYYLVTIGNTRCDSSGQVCTDACVPWSFTTSAVVPQKEAIMTLVSPTIPSASPTSQPRISPTAVLTMGPSPTSGLTKNCEQVKLHLGASSKDASRWGTLKQYDMDGNKVVNGLDIIKCQKVGK